MAEILNAEKKMFLVAAPMKTCFRCHSFAEVQGTMLLAKHGLAKIHPLCPHGLGHHVSQHMAASPRVNTPVAGVCTTVGTEAAGSGCFCVSLCAGVPTSLAVFLTFTCS